MTASSGRITIDGVDVRQVDQVALRRQIGIALQESILFTGTIRDNITMAGLTPARRRSSPPRRWPRRTILSWASRRATRSSAGAGQPVGRAEAAAGGARALLARPSILILDDSTSAVDVETEGRIQDALAGNGTGPRPTRFVVAQRISTVLTADKIIVLDDGEIAAAGTHRELLAGSPIYREIYASQMEAVAPLPDEPLWPVSDRASGADGSPSASP